MQSARLPHRPEDETLVDAGFEHCRQRFLFLRLLQEPVPHHQRRGTEGGHQQHGNSKHDLYKDVAEVWAVVRRSGEYGLRVGVFFRGRATEGRRISLVVVRIICRWYGFYDNIHINGNSLLIFKPFFIFYYRWLSYLCIRPSIVLNQLFLCIYA